MLISCHRIERLGLERMEHVWANMDSKLPHLHEWNTRLDQLVVQPIMRGERCADLDVDLELNGKPFYNRLIETDQQYQYDFDEPHAGTRRNHGSRCTIQ